jgi:hypothetical protein
MYTGYSRENPARAKSAKTKVGENTSESTSAGAFFVENQWRLICLENGA